MKGIFMNKIYISQDDDVFELKEIQDESNKIIK